MKVIDSRYKIDKVIRNCDIGPIYRAKDIRTEKLVSINIYNQDSHSPLIKDLIKNRKGIGNLNHDKLLSFYEFRRLKYLDGKRVDGDTYYSVTDYLDGQSLEKLEATLSSKDKLKIILDLIDVINYLHHRGYTYDYLTPSNILIYNDKNIKIKDFSVSYEGKHKNYYEELSNYFISPRVLEDKSLKDKKNDYYSLGVLIKYFLLEDFTVKNLDFAVYKDYDLSHKSIKEVNKIISELTMRNLREDDVDLLNIGNKLISLFNLDYRFDIQKHREKLYFNNDIIGRTKELKLVENLDYKNLKGDKNYRNILIRSDSGVGKTTLLEELASRLEFQGRNVYLARAYRETSKTYGFMADILKQTLDDVSRDIISKYENEISKLVPELKMSLRENREIDLNQRTDRLRLYNRVAGYLTESFRHDPSYILIDDLQNISKEGIELLDYLVRNTRNSKVFFIFATDLLNKENHKESKDIIDSLVAGSLLYDIEIHRLNIEETGELLRRILGISKVPDNFTAVIYKESNGNPKYIEYMVKSLYSRNELYMKPDGKWYLRAENYEDISFPVDIDEALERQLEVIRDYYYDIFKIMSIFPNGVDRKTLLNMADESLDNIESLLNDLVGFKLIEEKFTDWGYSYNINSNEIKRQIYNELEADERINLHKRAGDILESYTDRNLESTIEDLTYHLIKSNQKSKALDLLIKNAEGIIQENRSYSLYLWESAYDLIKDERSSKKLYILENILKLYSMEKLSLKADNYLKEYLKDAVELKDYEHIINGKLITIEGYFKMTQTGIALREIEKVEKIAKEKNIIEGQILALIYRARYGVRYMELDKVDIYLKEAKNLSVENKLDKHLGLIYNLQGVSFYLNGKTSEAIEFYKKSIDFYKNTKNPLEMAKSMNNLANVYVENYGNLEEAMNLYEQGLDIVVKNEIKDMEIVYLINISEIYKNSFQYDKAFSYIEKTRKGALKTQDFNILFLSYVNIGYIHLATGNYTGAYEAHKYLKNLYDLKDTLRIEVEVQYNSFLGILYGFFGKWEKSINHLNRVIDLSKKYSKLDYLTAKKYKAFFSFLSERTYNRQELREIVKDFEPIQLRLERRKMNLLFALMGLLSRDYELAQEMLNNDLELVDPGTPDLIDWVRKFLLAYMEEDGDIKDLVGIERKLSEANIFSMGLFANMAIAKKAYDQERYEEALGYVLEALDNIYRTTISIPDEKIQKSYISSRHGDDLKALSASCFEKTFNQKIDYIKLDEIDKEGLYQYFDLTPILKNISKTDFSKLSSFGLYQDEDIIEDYEDLLQRMGEDCKENLDVLLKFLSRQSLARVGYIMSYDEDGNLNLESKIGDIKGPINMGVMSLVLDEGHGVILNNSYDGEKDSRTSKINFNGMKSIICVPVKRTYSSQEDNDRRRTSVVEDRIEGFIYLETDKIFNRFDKDRLKLIEDLSFIALLNIENIKLKTLATSDKLTGVFTRKHYEAEFERFLKLAKKTDIQFSMLMLDIDNFKNVNDTYGHRKGDQVLTALGKVLKSSVRSNDIVARYGGEEFVIILKNIGIKKTEEIAETIRAKMEALYIPEIPHSITISIGISVFPDHGDTIAELTEKADQALYTAKDTGKNKLCFWTEKMEGKLNRADKLAGILTGNTNNDNRVILALFDIIDLIGSEISFDEKINIFLDKILKTVDGYCGTIILPAEFKRNRVVYTRTVDNPQWLNLPRLNYSIIERVMRNQKGEYLIDWDSIENVDSVIGNPQWESIIVLPLIEVGKLKGIVYLSVPIDKKEFDFNSFNIAKTFSNVFASII